MQAGTGLVTGERGQGAFGAGQALGRGFGISRFGARRK
jgi:hypothetical protein